MCYCDIRSLRHVRESLHVDLPEPLLAASLVLDWVTVILCLPVHPSRI